MKGIKAFLQNLSPLLFVLVFMSCKEKKEEYLGIPLPIKALQKSSAITTFEFLGAIEGKVNVEIRPQVEGVLEKIYIDEGAFVQAGQPLFKVNELPYVEQMKNAQASVAVEKARVENARIELDRLRPLVDNGVISDIQLRTAQSNFELAKASLTQAQTTEATARINLNFTNIKAPVSGYIGRIPKRIGNLVAKNDNQPMTVLSDIEEVFVYFAMSESDYLFFKRMSMDSTEG
jgi:membrane fusion protein (multidrug efflux system)